MIEVRLFAPLRKGRGKVITPPADEFPTAGDIFHHLQIPTKEAAILFINRFRSKLNDTVKADDIVASFQPVGGD